MFKSIVTHLRAAVVLIIMEDLKALRVLIKSVGESFARPSRLDRKT